MGYRYYNPNPSGRMVGDCVIRAISKATNRSWEEIYVKVAIQGLMMHDMPSSNSVWGSFLYNQNFHRYSIPDMCPDCYTVAEFAEDNPIGTFVLATGTHVVTVQDGDYYDAWDSGSEIPAYFWTRKDLKSMLELQVNQIVAKGDINPQDLEMPDKAVDIIKDIETICAMREAGYSQTNPYTRNGYSYAMDEDGYSRGWFDPVYHEGRNYHTNGGTHTDGMSYMQRPMNYRRGYSRDEAKDHMLDTLEDMMEEATTEKERNAIRRCMEKIRA